MRKNIAVLVERDSERARAVAQSLTPAGWATMWETDTSRLSTAYLGIQPQAMLVDLPSVGPRWRDVLLQLLAQFPTTPLVAMASNAQSAMRALLHSALGLGATFTLEGAPSADEIVDTVEDAALLQRTGRTARHALVVEDSNTQRRIVRETLRAAGWRVTALPEMEDVFARHALTRFDAAVIDIFLPGMGGIAGIKRLLAERGQLKILAVSAGLEDRMSSDNALEAALRLGAHDTLTKPFAADALVAKLNALSIRAD